MKRAPSTRKLALTLTLAAALTGPLASAGVAHAAGGFSVRPAETSPSDPATRSYFKPVMKPGDSLVRHVIVANGGDQPLSLLVSGVDALTGQTTGTVYANMNDPVRKAGAWLTPQTRSITIPAHSQATVGFAIHVPGGAEPGDHVAGIAFQDARQRTSGGHFRIIEVIREVVGVAIRVPGPAAPKLSLGQMRLTGLPGTTLPSVVVGVGNGGRLLCQPKLSVSLRGGAGHGQTVVRQLDTVLPGDAVAYPLPWPRTLAKGSYAAHAMMSCDGQTVTRDASLTLGRNLISGRGGVPTHPSSLPTWVLLVAVALGGMLAGVLLGRRRRREEPTTVPATVPPTPPAPAHASSVAVPPPPPPARPVTGPAATPPAVEDDSYLLPDPGRITQADLDPTES
ncbi:MAG: DUF916 domain-containing protein [Actinobacteria bacterium]|nr:DUF916 domain-containing protein [Actinomycetota bacterium]